MCRARAKSRIAAANARQPTRTTSCRIAGPESRGLRGRRQLLRHHPYSQLLEQRRRRLSADPDDDIVARDDPPRAVDVEDGNVGANLAYGAAQQRVTRPSAIAASIRARLRSLSRENASPR